MSNQLITLPKNHTLKKRLRDRIHDQKAGLVLSIASVLMVTLVVNQWLTHVSQNQVLQNGRGIASFEKSDIKQSIKWEHELALQLAAEEGLSLVSLAEKPTLRDELVFGALQGRYGIKLNAGFVESVEFLESQSSDDPVAMVDAVGFLRKFKSVWSRPFNEVRLRSADNTSETYQLLDKKMTLVGQVKIKKDPQGRLLSLDFISQ